MKWNPMVPELLVTDFGRSLAFYTELLGFTLAFERDEPRFAYLDYGGAQLMLEELHEGAWVTAELQAPLGRGINLQIEVPQVQPIAGDDASIGGPNQQKVRLHRVAARHQHANRRRGAEGDLSVFGREPDEANQALHNPLMEKAGSRGHIQRSVDHLIAVAVRR
jgi:catechol 2,3-dioxygenase-like lactoylglutathione lyase family enzyme